MKLTAKKYWEITKKTFIGFLDDNPMLYAAAIAFYTIFSMPAMLLIIIKVAGSVLGEKAVRGELSAQIQNLVGHGSAKQIEQVIENAWASDTGAIMTIVGIATLMFSATTVFVTIQTGLNAIWKVKPKSERAFLKMVIDRVLSFAMVLGLGFIMLVTLLIDTTIVTIHKFIRHLLEDYSIYLILLINTVISLGLITVVFGFIFKVLPDAKVHWRDVWKGAFFTTILFIIGKYLIGLYIGNTDLGSTYGAAGSLVILLVWVYYSSVILLLGAKFTQVYAHYTELKIEPKEYAVGVEMQEIEKDEV